ncbi:MAG TPA: TOBE domain-containing protein [Thermoplasmata archaeon]|nr:TOBE domain-containing protein [Thermoplasmata archaeon]
MTERPRVVTDTDVALLRTVAGERSVVAASRRVGISRDRATYRLARLERAFGGPVVVSVRGGRGHGATQLTALGDRIVRRGFDSVELLEARPVAPPSRSNLLDGVYHRGPAPMVTVGKDVQLRVAFPGEEGERVSVLLDPESILLARGKFPSSARNLLPATVEEVRHRAGSLGWTLVVRTGPVRLRVAITEEPVHQLRLVRGARVWLYVKATAVRRVGRVAGAVTRGSPRR